MAPRSFLKAPPLVRRLSAAAYEAVMLLGILAGAGFLYTYAAQQYRGLEGRFGMQIFLFIVLGSYFCGFWHHGGQTLAMRAWKIRLTDRSGQPASVSRIAIRYVLAWIWCLPPCVISYTLLPSGILTIGRITGFLAAWICLYAVLSYLRTDRQFLHDAVCGTRLIDTRTEP